MTRKKNPLVIKNRRIAKLATKALKDKFTVKPQRGYKYLKDLEIGQKFRTPTGTTGVVLDISSNAKVRITDVPSIVEEEDKGYYLGRKTISSDTEVKEIKNG